MYKLEPVVADGGELIIYAPHIHEISLTHGHLIRQVGYHCRDYFLKQWDKFKDIPWGTIAHSTHVRGIGTYENGVEHCRVQVTLATGIPEAVCKEINLGYRDPRHHQPRRLRQPRRRRCPACPQGRRDALPSQATPRVGAGDVDSTLLGIAAIMAAMTAILDLPDVRRRVSRLSVEEYHRLGEFNEDGKRTELLRGFVIEKMSKSPLHSHDCQSAFQDDPAPVARRLHCAGKKNR